LQARGEAPAKVTPSSAPASARTSSARVGSCQRFDRDGGWRLSDDLSAAEGSHGVDTANVVVRLDRATQYFPDL
jgi:hypothetical protein